MGSIPQYQRKQFASSYVGGAQRDESGALAIGAVQDELVEPIRKNEIAKLKAREEAASNLQANNVVIDYALAVQRGLGDLQKKYASNSEGYLDASQEFMQKEANSFAKGIENIRVRNKFLPAAGSIRKAAIGPAFRWAQDQQTAIAAISVEAAARTTALAASQARSPEEYAATIAALDDTDKMAEGIVDLKTRETAKAKAHKASMEAFIGNTIQNDPIGAKKMLKSGVLDKMPGYDAALKAKYISKAETKLRSDQSALHNDMRDNANRMSIQAIAGATSVEAIVAAMESSDPKVKILEADGKNILSALVRTVRTDAQTLANKNNEARGYLDMLNKFVSDKVDRAQFMQKILQVYQDGHKDDQELVFLATLKDDLNNIEAVNKRKAVAQAIDGAAKAYASVYPFKTEKDMLREADVLKGMIFNIYKKDANPDREMRRVAGQALIDRLAITDTTVIDKDGLTYKDNNGKGVTVFRSRVPGEEDVYYYRNVSP